MLLASLLTALGLAQAVVCAPPANAATLWANPTTRFVVVGEVHGTAEVPAAFAELVCAASADRSVVVGLEYEDSAQSAFDTWMASDGSPSARAALVESTAFTRRFEDGRSSEAMLRLMDQLRLLKSTGRDIHVVAIRPSTSPPDGFDQNYGELAIAQKVSEMAQARPEALALVLIGRFHASQTAMESFLPAIAHIPAPQVMSISLSSQGGDVWTCGGDGPVPECGPNAMNGSDDGSRGVILQTSSEGAFDGSLALGPVTASPPARGGFGLD